MRHFGMDTYTWTLSPLGRFRAADGIFNKSVLKVIDRANTGPNALYHPSTSVVGSFMVVSSLFFVLPCVIFITMTFKLPLFSYALLLLCGIPPLLVL
jgi:hypothetical protein